MTFVFQQRWLGLCLLLALVVLAGCGQKGPTRVKVTGTVKYSDGSIPTGEVCVIRFEPTAMGPGTKAASGSIAPDGTYSLTTMDPNDGAFPGDYKVTYTIRAAYDPKSPSLVAPQFMTAATTPHSATVKVGEKNDFPFVIEKQ